MVGLAADVEQAAVDAGVEGFDAAVEHFGEAGEFADVFDGEAGVTEGAGSAAGRDEFDAVRGEGLRENDQAGLVGNAEESAANLFYIAMFTASRHVWSFTFLKI